MASHRKHNTHNHNKEDDQQNVSNQTQLASDQALRKRILALREENYDAQKGWANLAEKLSAEPTNLSDLQAVAPSAGQKVSQAKPRPVLSFWKMAVAATVLLAAGFFAGWYSYQNNLATKALVSVGKSQLAPQQRTNLLAGSPAHNASIKAATKKGADMTKSGPDAKAPKRNTQQVIIKHRSKTPTYAMRQKNTKVQPYKNLSNKKDAHSMAYKAVASANPVTAKNKDLSTSLPLNNHIAITQPDWHGQNSQKMDSRLSAAVADLVTEPPLVATAVIKNHPAPSAFQTKAQQKQRSTLPVIAGTAINMLPIHSKRPQKRGRQNNGQSNIYKAISQGSGSSLQAPFKIRL